MQIQIKQHLSILTEAQADKLSGLIILLPEAITRNNTSRSQWGNLPYGSLLKQRVEKQSGNKQSLFSELPNKIGTRLTLTHIEADSSPFQLLTQARNLTRHQLKQSPKSIAILLAGFTNEQIPQIVEKQIAALLAAAHTLPSFKSDQTKKNPLTTIHIYGLEKRLDLNRTVAEAEGNNLARDLAVLPGNHLTPTEYRQRASKLAKAHGWKQRFYDLKSLKKKGAGAFLAVAQASPIADAGILHLRYSPSKPTKKRALALVGKGICFDTGGVNIKPGAYMYNMHQDMAGSAVALGTLLALSQLKVDFPVDCWLALAENHIGPEAYKPSDVVTALNGTSIEIINTDAEGRMVLADTLTMASRNKPEMIIDYATLTGACTAALSTRYSGAFTNRDDLIPKVIDAGVKSGERVWPFPMDDDFDDAIKSDIADIQQCSSEGQAGHITAARFLQRFVENDTPWIHLDLSAKRRKGGLGHIPTEATGFGVRFTLNLVLDRDALL